MEKHARNKLCPCGSGIKHKRCCLNRGVGVINEANMDFSSPLLIRTLTEELFQPVRLYYTLHDRAKLDRVFEQLTCMEYNEALEDWTLTYAAEAAEIHLEVPPNKVPAPAQPLILATIYFEHDEMLVDLRSIERAVKIIEFINQHVPRAVVEITYTAIYNKLITADNDDLTSISEFDFDEIFNDERITIMNPDDIVSEMESAASQYENKDEAWQAAQRASDDAAKKPLPEVEKMPIYYYEEGIDHFETMCKFRQMIAAQHFFGRKDYSFYDLTQELLHRVENVE